MNGTGITFRAELKIIPQLAWFLAFVAGICGAIAVFAGAHLDKSVPRAAVPFLAILCGVVAVCWILLLGYVNADARRRAMSPLLWTLICIFVPNLIGFILFFLLRKPLARFCNKCGFRVEEGFRYCPNCNSPQAPVCSRCGQPLKGEYAWCPYCGQAAAAQGTPTVTPG
jgi:RNA polymerase subunit RPABC4/transcription elongation factor Spt4